MRALTLSSRSLSGLALALVLALPLCGQSLHATRVEGYAPGTGGGIFDPNLALGGPRGQAGTDVTSLGEGGSLTLGFDVTLTDGPGIDFVAFENGFVFPTGSTRVFGEVAYVEVSSNGTDFARFPVGYAGPAGQLPAFGTEPMGTWAGFCGGMPVLADVVMNAIDTANVARAGGDGFDLADLANDPLVLAGTVDLTAITRVRFVDCVAGMDRDRFGRLIEDVGGTGSSADIDAVRVVNHTGNRSVGAPTVALEIDALGRLVIRARDPDGLQDLDFATFDFSVSTFAVSLPELLTLTTVQANGPNEIVATTTFPVDVPGFLAVFGVSLADRGGRRVADQLALQ